MSTHLLPKFVCKSMNTSFKNFWWGTKKDQKHKLYLKSWKSICQPKNEGGLGLRLMENMNMALLAKTGWEISQANTNVWHSILTKKYLKTNTFWQVTPKVTDSIFWKHLLQTRKLLEQDMCYQISNGTSVSAWIDPWIPSLESFRLNPLSHITDLSPSLKVSDFIIQESHYWNLPKMKQFFSHESIKEILKIPLPSTRLREDRHIWVKNHNGKFSVKTAYHLAAKSNNGIQVSNSNMDNTAFEKIWKLKIHDRHKLLLWKIFWDIPPTRGILKRFLSSMPSLLCPLCNEQEETLFHLFIECPISRILWRQSRWPLNISQW
ncbi:hypothetical protein CIPAW_14G089200 [Carya illinoinensis]|uniref:Reverse transcriptase zinc-binding domain-containing protein n=1 Tax=Carya illinoinensis TaxID=32201 RepID=A0A8T1NKS0_CARIL|nr:hypothetical protein CIPAW_14G089200 [Carya illinoinensis]